MSIIKLEEICLKLEDMESHMTNSQFMVQVINSLTNDYELQKLLMENRIGNKESPLSINEIQVELSLRCERLSLVSEATNDIDLTEKNSLFNTQCKGKCQNCEKMDHKATDRFQGKT
jgi:hypothetical protein